MSVGAAAVNERCCRAEDRGVSAEFGSDQEVVCVRV